MAGELVGEDCKTRRSARRDRKKCVEAAFDDYATKPIDRRKLSDTIKAHLGLLGAHVHRRVPHLREARVQRVLGQALVDRVLTL